MRIASDYLVASLAVGEDVPRDQTCRREIAQRATTVAMPILRLTEARR